MGLGLVSIPRVMTELTTIRALHKPGRRSLARYGDGEIKIMDGKDCKSQPYDPVLAERLREIARSKTLNVYVGIPRIFDATYGDLPAQKQHFWAQYRAGPRARFWHPGKRYASAFVTRLDHYPALDTPDYWRSIRALWDGRAVLFLRGGAKGDAEGEAPLLSNARSVEHVGEVPAQDAWPAFGRLMAVCRSWAAHHPDGLVVLCVGATATVMAHDLGAEGIQGLDLGHLPLFFSKSPYKEQICSSPV